MKIYTLLFYIITILILLTTSVSTVKGTAQIPDLLIYKGDTVSLFANPLEAFYHEQNPRPRNFGVSTCWSTACWRGYQALWEIKDDRLFLLALFDCCLHSDYKLTDQAIDSLQHQLPANVLEKLLPLKGEEIPYYNFYSRLKKQIGKRNAAKYRLLIARQTKQATKKADLARLFGEKYKDGKVLADWFTGDLSIPKGKLLQYVHMGYMSTYEKELVFTLEKGAVIAVDEYENKPGESKEGYTTLKATSFSFLAPAEVIQSEKSYIHTLSDTISFINALQTKKLQAMAAFNEKRLERAGREVKVVEVLDSLKNLYGENYRFDDRKIEKVRWGIAGWIDGHAINGKGQIRLYTIVNINGRMMLVYEENENSESSFKERVDYMSNSVRLLEFSY